VLSNFAFSLNLRRYTERIQTTKHWWWKLDDDEGVSGGGSGGGGGGGSGGGGSGGGSPPAPARPLDEVSVGPSTRRGALTALLNCIRGGDATCRCFAHGPAHPGLVGRRTLNPC
jgi:hypothetical protein